MVWFGSIRRSTLLITLAWSWVGSLWVAGGCLWITGCEGGQVQQTASSVPTTPDADGVYHVYPGQDIQAALDRAAHDPQNKTVLVHAGTYRPQRPAQAFIWLNRKHDGITLAAQGEVILTAANKEVADFSQGFPAVVNHVVYFGDGVSPSTTLRGFRITGANNFVTKDKPVESMEPSLTRPGLTPTMFFYTDGGGIKIFGRPAGNRYERW